MTGVLTMSNCTLSKNVATYGRGGALFLASNATIGSCTFHGNADGGDDRKLERNVAAMYVNSGVVSVRATIFDESRYDARIGVRTNEVACKGAGTVASQGYNIDRGASCQFATSTDKPNTKDPKLDPNLANNGGPTQTHALLAGSPAIGAIQYMVATNAGFVPPTDQRGVRRPQAPPNTGFTFTSWVVDIGAVEYVYPVLPTLTLF